MDQKYFLELVTKRTSCRAYKADPVSDDILEYCLEAARLSPSACNKQPWRFVIVKDEDKRRQLCEKGLLPFLPMPWTYQAPVIVALCAVQTTTVHKLAAMISGVKYHLIDCGIAGEHFVLAAEEKGLGSCWIGWFRERKVKKILGIPRGVKVISLLTLGYPEQVSPPRSRLTMEDISFKDQWNNKL